MNGSRSNGIIWSKHVVDLKFDILTAKKSSKIIFVACIPENILIYLVVWQILLNFEAVFMKFAVAYSIVSRDSLLKMLLVLQNLRRQDVLTVHYCMWGYSIGKGANHRGNESHYLWEAFIMRFVTWRLEILAKFQNDSVTWQGNDRCSWDVFIMPWYHSVHLILYKVYLYGMMGQLYQLSAWVSVRCSFLTGWAMREASRRRTSDKIRLLRFFVYSR